MCISGTHTHSGPAGYFQYLLYEVTSLGFVQETLDSLVDGKKFTNLTRYMYTGWLVYICVDNYFHFPFIFSNIL